jgi:tetratricopeptide (TPR) repeat protein
MDASLDDMISSHRKSVTLRPLGHPYRSISLNNLGNILYTRFEQLGRMEDLEDAISSHREALTLRPLGDRHRPSSLNNLGNALFIRFEQLGRMEDLEAAISSHREALTLRPLGDRYRSGSLNNLAIALFIRFRQSGRMEDLEDTISSHREALTLDPLGHPDRSRFLNNLASSLSTRFEQLGRMVDLEDAISSHREALRPLGHPDRYSFLNNLANSLSIRFDQSGRMEDLEDTITCHREALTLRPHSNPDRSGSLDNLGNALLTRFKQSGRMEDLEDAISSHREALALRPLGHPYRSGALNNLANSLFTRFKLSGSTEDLKDAISFYREALTLLSGHPDRSSCLNNLSSSLSTRFQQSGRIEDLEDAISSQREALTLHPLGHPDRSASLNTLANVLSTRFGQLGRIEDLEESFILYEQAANDLTSSPRHRLVAATHWASSARRYHHKSIICAYSISLRILDRCLIFHPSIESQQKFLATAHIPRSLASDAASAAIGAGDLEAAVELLEQGRAILWSKMEGYRYPLNQLHLVDKELADRLQTLSIELEFLSVSPGSGRLKSDGPMVSAPLEVRMRRYRILTEDWEKAVERVRTIEGFGNFLQAVPFDTLRVAAAEGPVILVNISKYRSDAIILHDTSPPLLVTLPNLQPKDLTHLAEQLTLARDAGDGADHSNIIPPILRALWSDIASPVVKRLTEMGIPERSRVWWCPTSKLCALPLHAAGPYRPKEKNLPDIYVSSYITTLSALIKARSNTFGQSAVPRLLVVGQPDDELLNVQAEIDNLRQLGDFVDVLVGTEANHDTILHGLQQHSWAHFACHGHLGVNTQPFYASFELHGGSSLTLLDLIQARLPNAELAFLSACHSAEGDLITPDETIHLAAALQFCGFRSVVGTLWAMDDKDGPVISMEFYKHMFRKPGNKANFRDSAEALNLAIRAMRKNRVPLERWILFVHIGA